MTFSLLSAVYGLGWTEILDMPLAAIRIYLERVPNIIALRKLIAGEGAVVPYAKNYQEILRSWSSAIFGEEHRVKATPGMLKMIGIGVKHV